MPVHGAGGFIDLAAQFGLVSGHALQWHASGLQFGAQALLLLGERLVAVLELGGFALGGFEVAQHGLAGLVCGADLLRQFLDLALRCGHGVAGDGHVACDLAEVFQALVLLLELLQSVLGFLDGAG